MRLTGGRAISRDLSAHDLILYVVIGVFLAAAAIAWPIVVPERFWLSHAWFSFVFFTALLAAILARLYWHVRRRTQIWSLLAAFMAIHTAVYVTLLHYVPNWPAFLYIVTGPAEVILFVFVAKSWLHVMPTATRL